MASISNLMVTPPTNCLRSNFIEVSESDLFDKSHEIPVVPEKTAKWYASLCKFHGDRVLEISGLSNDILKSTRALEQKLSIDIQKIEKSFKANTVCVVPSKPEVLDPLVQNWEPPTGCKYRFSSSESYLCVSSLPEGTDNDEAFLGIVSKFGPVVNAFLVYHHLTDESLGLGLVEYCSREVACQARNLLHQNKGIFCDWLDHRLVTYSCLYSRCLIARCPSLREERMKEDFKITASPIYCQLVPGTDIVLVEYLNSEDAMSSQRTLLSMKEDEKCIVDVRLANPVKSVLKLHQKILDERQESQKVENTSSLTPIFPYGQFPLPILGHHLKLLGSLFPAPLAVSPPKWRTVGYAASLKNRDTGLISHGISSCVINAFGFNLPCSPIVQSRTKKANLSSSSLPDAMNAFGFSLPCSPILKILGLNSHESPVTQGIKSGNQIDRHHNSATSPHLLTPPGWKNFKLKAIALTPDKSSESDSALDLTCSIVRNLEATVLQTPPESTVLTPTRLQLSEQKCSESTPVRASQSHTKRLGKRLLDCQSLKENSSNEKEEAVSRSGFKKRLVLSQIDNTTQSTSWCLDSTWLKWKDSHNSKECLREKMFPSAHSENRK